MVFFGHFVPAANSEVDQAQNPVAFCTAMALLMTLEPDVGFLFVLLYILDSPSMVLNSVFVVAVFLPV
jgi:hypothetical protein